MRGGAAYAGKNIEAADCSADGRSVTHDALALGESRAFPNAPEDFVRSHRMAGKRSLEMDSRARES